MNKIRIISDITHEDQFDFILTTTKGYQTTRCGQNCTNMVSNVGKNYFDMKNIECNQMCFWDEQRRKREF